MKMVFFFLYKDRWRKKKKAKCTELYVNGKIGMNSLWYKNERKKEIKKEWPRNQHRLNGHIRYYIKYEWYRLTRTFQTEYLLHYIEILYSGCCFTIWMQSLDYPKMLKMKIIVSMIYTIYGKKWIGARLLQQDKFFSLSLIRNMTKMLKNL